MISSRSSGRRPRRELGVLLARAAAASLLLLCLTGALRANAGTFVTGDSPSGIALNPSTGLLYVANTSGGSVSIIVTATGSLLTTIELSGTLPLGGAAAPVGIGVDVSSDLVFVAETGAKEIAVIDGATSTLRATLAADVGPWGVAVNQTTNTVYVSALGGSVRVFS